MVYVDDARISWRGRLWCHMVADSLDELHEFALRLGLKRSWFQGTASYPHYDVTLEMRSKAIALGAVLGERKVIAQCAKKLKVELREQAQAQQ